MDMQQSSSLSPEMLMCQTLRAATDNNHETVLKAEDQLSEWEALSRFFPTLTRICLSVVDGMDPLVVQQLDTNVRWMAAVYLKNGIYRYWKRGTIYELPQAEKEQIRGLLLMHYVNEAVPQICQQIASAIARIARIDYPNDWPELLPELLKRLEANASKSVIGQQDSGEQQRVLLTMHYVLKAIASSPLNEVRPEMVVFQQISSNIYEFIYRLWDTYCTLFFHQLKEAPVAMAKSTLENSILCTRILRKLTVYGFSNPEESTDCLRYIEVLFERLKVCLNCRFELRQLNADQQLVTLLEKFILKQMKTLLEFQDSFATAFKSFVATALQFTFDHVFHVSAYLIVTDNSVNFQQFAIICVNLMMGLMSPFYWQKVDKSWNPETNKDNETRLVLKNFFADDRLSYICEKIITYYFILTQSELDLWLEDPEGFAQEENAGDMCKYALRPCMDSLFSACFTIYEPQMSAEVLKYIQKAQQTQLSENSDFKDILLKDAIYNAAGQAATNLFELDFDAWFSDQLLNELKIDSANFRILRRRIIWLLGEWAGVKFSPELRPLAYESCLYLLRPCEDMSIRLASASCLSLLIDDFDFAPIPFIPYLEQSFNALYGVLCAAKECDTKCKLLRIISSIVEKMSDNIESYADNLILCLPMLWKESEGFSMLRNAIISTLIQVVSAIENLSETIHPFLFSVIRLSTDIKSLFPRANFCFETLEFVDEMGEKPDLLSPLSPSKTQEFRNKSLHMEKGTLLEPNRIPIP